MADLNAVPEGWVNTKIGEISEILDSKRIPLNSQERAERVGIFPYYGANGIQGFIDSFIFEGEHVLLAEDGGNFDQWETKPISYLVKGKFWVNNHAHILKAKKDNLTKFLHYSLVHKNILKHINGGTRAKLNQSDMRDIQIICPPLPEQQKIAAILTSVDEVIEKTQAQINKLKDLKTGMMQELLTRGVGIDGKAHTEFKDSPVGKIPKSWDILPLASLVVPKGLQTGPFGGQLHAEEYTEFGIPVIMPKNMKKNKICIADIARIPEEKANTLDKHRVIIGDIVFSRRGDIGRFALIGESNSYWICGTGALRARLNNSMSPLYLSSYLTLKPVIDWLNSNAVGQTMLNLNTSILGELPIVVPPIHEQKLIANAIDAIENSINKKENKLMTLMNTKKALMQDLLTGKVRVNIN